MKKIIITIIIISIIFTAKSQIRAIDGLPTTVLSGSTSAFLDASSNSSYDGSASSGKGIAFPRVDLSAFTSFLGLTGANSSFRTRYDGFIVYNTATSGVAGVGATQGGVLSPGFWYYDNSSAGVGTGTIGGGTWKAVGAMEIKTTESKGIIIDGIQTYAVKGSFTLASADSKATLTNPITGLTKVYRINIYNTSGTSIGFNSYDNTSMVLIFGGNGFSSSVVAGTYDYTIEYFK